MFSPHHKKAIKVLQCGYPKSGNYGVFKLLHSILEQNDMFISYKQQTGLTQLIDNVFESYKLFPEVSIVDSFWVTKKGFMLEFPHPKCLQLPVNEKLFVKYSSLLWTHEHADIIHLELLKPVTHWIYVLRDGRDVINSMIHHVTRSKMIKLMPKYRYTKVCEIYDDHNLFAKYVREWREHVRSYLKNKHNYICVRLEDIIEDPSGIILHIAESLELPVNIDMTLRLISYKEMSKSAKSHMRRGVTGDWKNHFTQEHKNIFKNVAGEELIKFGYEKDSRW